MVEGLPVGKPRMTQRDKWQQRPAVMRYREYCDRLRAAAPKEFADHDFDRMSILAFLPVKPSWAKKKKAALIGKPCRAKPDADNIIKSVGDALFEEDSKLWDVRCRKYWCAEGDEHTTVRLFFGS